MRANTIFLVLLLCVVLWIFPVAADPTASLTVTKGTSWSDYNTVTFEGSVSEGNITSWTLDFGDGSPAEGTSAPISATHDYPLQADYNTPDEYGVTLTVTVDNTTTVSAPGETVTIQEPTLEASANIETDQDNLKIIFSSDPEDANSYFWEFGDGYSYTGASDTHTYSASGIYNVTLTVTSAAGQEDEDTKDVIFTPTVTATATATANTTATATQSLLPDAYFTVDYDTGGKPHYVKFTDGSTSNSGKSIINWAWDFGYNNNTKTFNSSTTGFTDADTEFVYQYERTYTVTLTVTDGYGYQSTYEKEITVDDDLAPTASFTIDDDSVYTGNAPLTVQFENTSEEADSGSSITSCYWEFYDADNEDIETITSTSSNPEITFDDAGQYTVRFTVVDADGISDSIVKYNLITVNAPLSVTFSVASGASTSGNAPYTVTFSAKDGTNNEYDISNYYWSFGDGSVYSESDTTTTHTYTNAGTYSVSLKVTDTEGNTYTATKEDYITVTTKSVTSAYTYVIETTAEATTALTTTGTTLQGTKIFGVPGTEFFRSEAGRFYSLYEEYMAILGGLFGGN